MIAEKALLGTFLKHNYLLKDTTLKPEQLEEIRHQKLLKIMLQLARKGSPSMLLPYRRLPS